MEGKGVVTRIDGKTCLVLRRRMNQDEAEARDMNHEGEEPINPIVETEKGVYLVRRAFKDGDFEWAARGMFLTVGEQGHLEDAYAMGIAAADRERPMGLHLNSYNKGLKDGEDKRCIEDRLEGIEVGRKQMKADILEWLGGHYPKGA